MTPYLKAIVAAIVAGLGTAQVAYQHGHPSTEQWISIALTAAIALGGVWAVPNAAKKA